MGFFREKRPADADGVVVQAHLSKADAELAEHGGVVLVHADEESAADGQVHLVEVTIAKV